MATTPEGKVKKEIKKYLESIGAWYYIPVSNGMGRVGCPDILACYRGRFVAIEVKAPGKKYTVTANQQREIDWIKRANGLAVVADDVSEVENMFVIDEFIRRLGGEK